MIIDGKYKDIHIVLAEGWFKVLGMATVTGVIRYVADTKKSFLLELIFYLSLYLIFWYITTILVDVISYNILPKKYKKHQKIFNNILGHILSLIVIMLLYLVIISVTK